MNVDIGSIFKTHGFVGGIVINIESHHNIELVEDCINKKGLVFINIDGIPVPFFISNKVKVMNNKSILLFLDDIDNEIKAKKYINSRILIEDDCIDDNFEAELVINENLIGYTVYNINLGLIFISRFVLLYSKITPLPQDLWVRQ